MEQKIAKPPKLQVSPNSMEATLTFFSPKEGESEPEYTVADLLDLLEDQGVSYGISGEVLEGLCRRLRYETPIVVAVGQQAQSGTPGTFEYLFSQDFSKKPLIRPDGSVDYMSIKVIEIVHKGDVIARYHPATKGTPGITVRNTPIEPKPARDLPPLAGRGFARSEDNLTYTAEMDGKIVMQGRRITISPVYELLENADVATGNIDFNGDVVIHGGVSNGVIIRATGDVTVEGLVENCDMEVGGSIFLLRGIKGGGKTRIVSRHDITAQFIENAQVFAAGNVQADVFFRSNVKCEGMIQLTGKRASVIGGMMNAIEGIEAYNIGNDFGIHTEVIAGITPEMMAQADMMQQKIQAISDNVEKIKSGIREFDELGERRGISYKEDPRRMQLLRVKIRDEALIAEEKMKLDALQAMIERGKTAKVVVVDTIYPGVNLTIADQHLEIQEEQSRVEIGCTLGGIRLERLDDTFVQ